jgi:hypothetical protein
LWITPKTPAEIYPEKCATCGVENERKKQVRQKHVSDRFELNRNKAKIKPALWVRPQTDKTGSLKKRPKTF